jgi:ribonuclease HII
VSAYAAPAVPTKRPTKLTLGIDEAGRGPAIGPLVLAACALDTAAARRLTRAGLTDSKAFGAGPDAHAARSALAVEIRALATFHAVIEVDVATVDARVFRNELNALERDVAIQLIDQAPAVDQILADGARMFAPLTARYPNLKSLDRAESAHAAVAAASVLAKTARDEAFARIAARYLADFGPLRGGGYVNDATRAFLIAYARVHGRLPDEARRSWPHPYLAGLIPPVTDRPQLSLL